MNYWLDTFDNKIYYAIVILTDAEEPTNPPKAVRIVDLLQDNRFREVDFLDK